MTANGLTSEEVSYIEAKDSKAKEAAGMPFKSQGKPAVQKSTAQPMVMVE